MSSFRVIAYIDGFNLYYGLKAKIWQRYYWLDLCKMVRSLLQPTQTLVSVKYFTARVDQPPEKKARQDSYLDALGTLTDLEIIYGRYQFDPFTCYKCSKTYQIPHEKMSDVNLATELLSDAFQNAYDTALIISADADLVPPIKKNKTLFSNKRVMVFFPPERRSAELAGAAHRALPIYEKYFAENQFPEEITRKDGFVIKRPSKWK
jgi:hypothetical protein